jgi:uncharacterized membrane protein
VPLNQDSDRSYFGSCEEQRVRQIPVRSRIGFFAAHLQSQSEISFRLKTFLWFLGAISVIAVLAFLAGYFDPELADERRWLGAGLIVTGVAIAWPAVMRIVEDWPRMKPRYNVDLAFVQIGLGIAILVAAFMLGGRLGAFVSPLSKPAPNYAPTTSDRAPS